MNNKNAATVLLLGVLAGFLAAMILLLAVFGGTAGVSSALKYASVLRVLRTYFVADVDMQSVSDSAMAGAVSGIDDRWSYYMTAEEYADYLDYSANRYQGIGVTVQKDEETGGFRILSVNRDGPAMQAGIVVDDIILAVDGTDVTAEETTELRTLIQADFGGHAILTVQHESGLTEDISVSCEQIYTDPVEYEMLDDETGYIAIRNFRDGAAQSAIDAVEDLIGQGAERLVFDVRDDPGGQLTELVALLDYLLPEGDIFIRSDKAGHESVEVSDESCVELPMAVIVNGDSYSAAEFFAAALREYDWAVVVGEPTTGKSRSQVTVALRDGSAVHISKFRYLTPNRVDLFEAGGLTPDVETALSEEEYELFVTGALELEDDPQVQAAAAALEAAEIDGRSA